LVSFFSLEGFFEQDIINRQRNNKSGKFFKDFSFV